MTALAEAAAIGAWSQSGDPPKCGRESACLAVSDGKANVGRGRAHSRRPGCAHAHRSAPRAGRERVKLPTRARSVPDPKRLVEVSNFAPARTVATEA